MSAQQGHYIAFHDDMSDIFLHVYDRGCFISTINHCMRIIIKISPYLKKELKKRLSYYTQGYQ